jgi:D-alanyl-D-alanine carboxypeptidase/D-alanyl-D-alanine-endopeptidase (penicillin-binding protein 4)
MAECATHSAAIITPVSRIADARTLLRDDLERIFSDANFAGAQWGVEVVSLDRGEILYERNSGRLSMPASNNKILTVSSALLRLGPNYRYVTRVMTDGDVVGETLKGNLVIVGAGDPSTAARFREGDPFWVFKDWAARLKEKGVRILEGDLLGDDRAFGYSMLGAGWEWDDLGYGYAAPVSALQFNENLVALEISPGDTVGSQATIKQLPLPDYLTVECRVVTAAPETEAQIEVARGRESNSIVLRGAVPWKSKPTRQTVAVESPVDYYLRALKRTLAEAGIEVAAAQTRAVRETSARPLAPLWTYESPPLAEIVKQTLKVSQNLYAETLARTLGLALRGEGSFAAGKAVVEEALRDMAIENGSYAYVDGSGLSRLDLVSADTMVRIFKFMYRHKYFQQFYDALPIAGVDGTIASRMKGTRAENNAHAKTGSIAYVRSLSGYVRTADGEMLAFSMIANNFLVPSRAAEYVQDAAVERLANFTRREEGSR